MIALLACMMFQHVDNDIVYTTMGDKKLMLDAYRPATPNKTVVITVHGGEYVNGSKGGQTAEVCRYLANRGFTCFDIDYRLQKDVGNDLSKVLAASVSDTVEAFHWVETNCRSYGGDPNRISILGISGGAVTAMTAAYSKNVGVHACVDIAGGLFGQQSDIKMGDPPLLIIHGLNDKVISIGLARAIQNRAIRQKVPVRFIQHNGGHKIELTKEVGRFTLLESIDSFLRESIK